MKKNLLLLPLLLLIGIVALQAQITTPSASPSAKVTQMVGLTEVTIEYSRPSMKGRTIFAADGLVPFDAVWRTGANAATKITFSDAVTIEDNELPAGSYAILTKPGATSWAIHFYNWGSSNFGSYLEEDPTLVVNVTPLKTGITLETFTINVDGLHNNGATLQFAWDNTVVPVSLGVMTEKTVMASIDRVMSGPSKNDYFNAASYYHDSGKDLKKALEWVNMATEGDNPRYWQIRRKALILADLGMKKEAIAAAKQSLELAKAAGNQDYVRMNEKSLKEWMM
jgi:tetratricopeptide (TPR) repeat protein